jgi:hypothetical protein
MPKRKVNVFERGGEYVADPPIIELSGADTLRIINHTDEDLVWRVNDNTAFQGGNPILETVPKRGANGPGSSPAKNVANTANLFVAVSYQLIGVNTGKKAKGNSDPVIIVEN